MRTLSRLRHWVGLSRPPSRGCAPWVACGSLPGLPFTPPDREVGQLQRPTASGGAPLPFGHRLRRPLRGRARASRTPPPGGRRLRAEARAWTLLPAPLQGRGAGLRPHAELRPQSPCRAPACGRTRRGSPTMALPWTRQAGRLDRATPHSEAPRPPVRLSATGLRPASP